jgi:hypothetical protein
MAPAPGPRARRLLAAVAAALALGAAPPAARADETTVSTREALVRAVRAAKPGTRVRVAPGDYEGGLHFEGLRGEPGRPIVLEAADPARPPTLRGGPNGIHLQDPVHVVLRGLAISGATGNGINVDDGGTPATPAHHVTIEKVVVTDVGPQGNCDGIKLSGVVDVTVADCRVERWGRSGSAVDMVGCTRATIERCVFRHGPDATNASGVQAKGGSRDVLVRRNRFLDAGARAVNVGGSTGLAFFRPAVVAPGTERHEAKDVRVEGNVFSGGTAAAAFVGVDGATFRFNTVHVPARWAFRFLQETREPGFVPTRRVVVADNLVVFRSDRWSEGGVNVGPGTEPTSFRFERNAWFCVDAPSRTRELVRTPVPETGGAHGKDPLFVDAEALDLAVRAGSPAARVGAHALPD